MMEGSEKVTNGVGLVSCACWNDHATLKFEKCGFFFVLLVAFCGAGIFAPYFTTIARNLMPPFLPLVSNAAGVPPSTGVFAVFAEIGLFFGVFAFFLLFVTVNQRNVRQNRVLKTVNLTCLISFFFAWMGLVMTVCNPVGFTDLPNKFQWVVTVLYEHGFAATLILVGLAVFQLFFALMWWYLPDTSKFEKYTKLGFIVVYIILALIILYPLPAFVMEVLDYRPFDFEYMKTVSYTLPQEYSTFHLIVSVCEWTICILSVINVGLHSRDLQRVSCRVVFRHKSCLSEDPALPLKITSSTL